jgi:glycopeptide antibiotics resistance protein
MVMSTLQFAVFYKQLGNAFLMPQGESFMRWSSPQWMAVLFSGYHGLIPWSPLFLLAVIGLFKAMFRHRGIWRWFMLGAILTITATAYINACVIDWWAGWAYGARRFCCLIPFVALGAFEVVRSLWRRVAILLLASIILWSYFTYTCYRNQIDDLAVPLLGKPSLHSPEDVAETSYWIRNNEKAWDKLRRKLPSPCFSAIKLLPPSITLPDVINQLASAIILMIVCWGTMRLFLIWKHNHRLTHWAALCFLGYTVILTAGIIFRFPNSHRLNQPWKAYLNKQITAEDAVRQNLPLEPVYFVEALSHVSQKQIEEARAILKPINNKNYRYITIEKIIKLSYDIADKQ